MIAVRPVESDEDVEAWLHVRRAVVPHESAGTVEPFRERARVHPEHLYLLAELDGRLAGSGIAGLSDSWLGRRKRLPRGDHLDTAAQAAMRAVNEALGYEYRGVSVTMVAPLPLRAG
jgi:hypothetical protein